ncbi:peptidase domain-containing ABC transporter [Pedobacter zeae]|uniref:ABC transporter ATP-binding protein n=1 Tax=Pedobacter zeae TaxID=1737356 RepID=A0A7W6KDD5_9SPHI|nr:peptidase domain-containing ABC transporter [Pedobacter zeae]MBB4109664.1 ATP-binding cassette subfamily B protein [Pedobacter zeae]GGH13523.1 ABC transporter ATP-binding protein [Pedobacter zeae]
MKIQLANFPHYKQHDVMDCGPTCLQIITKFYGKFFSIQKIRTLSQIGKTGVSLLGISKAAEKIGIQSVGGNITFEKLEKRGQLPCIIHWRKNHFVVVYKITKKKVYISDPASGLHAYTHDEFLNNWAYTSINQKAAGIALLLSPTPDFYLTEEDITEKRGSMSVLLKHVFHYKKLLKQLAAGLLAGAVIQLIFPFFTKALVDVGVKGADVQFIYILLFGQLLMTLGQTSVELLRGWILLHITARVNLSILSNFLNKLLNLPLSFFDTKLNSDILQRIEDHKRIEALLTGSTLNTLFMMIAFLVFSVLLFIYSPTICMVFIIGSAIYFAWIYIFMEKRKKLDFKRFELMAQNRAKTLQVVNGIHEIKINDCGTKKIWEWEGIQAKLFRLNVSTLSLSQYQQVGATFINQAKNILILFLATRLVIDKQVSLGDMMAIQFIIGQMNAPIVQLASFLQSYQDAQISMDRLEQIQHLEDEESPAKNYTYKMPPGRSIQIKNMSFIYPGAGNKPVLNNLDFTIPGGKTTAIVGSSGSGKTTILKLLQRISEPTSGEIYVDNLPFSMISPKFWRQHCGVVMQDGFIFSDTIANNIALNEEFTDPAEMDRAIHIANIEQYIKSQPLGIYTKIGEDGKGLSGGQRQRVLIARMVYRNPEYIFLDEATSSLDSSNEKVIMERLYNFFEGKTVLIVAHRLSTVKNADNILVLDNGNVVEQGDHNALVAKRGYYYELIKNQLELGN